MKNARQDSNSTLLLAENNLQKMPSSSSLAAALKFRINRPKVIVAGLLDGLIRCPERCLDLSGVSLPKYDALVG